ncbi:MAG: hypothetical protein EON58_07485 [Alphaproteobacteria bacterium]|nr:MAG: hypothetical protein EON58_07485 [Alphaproteobacteria bacterium]
MKRLRHNRSHPEDSRQTSRIWNPLNNSQSNLLIISRKCLIDFSASSRGCEASESISNWVKDAERANWTSYIDIKRNYPRAREVGPNKVVFELCKGQFLLLAVLRYGETVKVGFIGTRRELERLHPELHETLVTH